MLSEGLARSVAREAFLESLPGFDVRLPAQDGR